MNKRDLSRLQRLIDRTVRTQNAFHVEQERLMEFCRERYGVEPGDIDADAIIDGVLGGCGMASGMSAEDFDAAMRGEGR